MTPPNVHVLIPKTCEYVTCCGKRDFAVVIELWLLRRWGDYSRGPNVITRVLAEGRRGRGREGIGSPNREGGTRVLAEFGARERLEGTRCHLGGRRRGPPARESKRSPEAAKAWDSFP